MTNYNDGKWHGWNGGECPVHSKSVVSAVLFDETNKDRPFDAFSTTNCAAGQVDDSCWRHAEAYRAVVAFRVVKEYREPRDFWLVHVPGDVTEFTLHHCEAAALLEQREEGGRILHVREVLE